MMFDNVRLVHENFPDKPLLFTEGTVDTFKVEDINNWRLGEYYGHSMINDFNDGAVGWTDWNVLLDEQGGPNHVGNFCHAPVLVDGATGIAHYQPSFHYIAHFSKFVRPGAVRVELRSDEPTLQSIAFANPDGGIVAVVSNPGDEARDFSLTLGEETQRCHVPGHAIHTYLRG